ncbi:MAG: hypothetical protein M0P44_07855 [Clostridiales bacterium]|nr:hypothetical protein [Clostridiales bacterium]
MARATFTNQQLCVAWAAAAKSDPKGTRGDVVRALMRECGIEDNDANYRKMYNNVTQRVKQLGNHATKPVRFPTLQAGPKGARRTLAELDALQSIFDGPDADADQESTDGTTT